MKQTFLTLSIVTLLFISMSAITSADGGMMLQSTQQPESVAGETSALTATDRIARLTELVRLTSYVQALVLGMPTSEQSDEGALTVAVSDTMRFACDGKANTDGQWCVRHVGELGESYIDLDTVIGFPYDERFAYTLTLMRTRADLFGTTGEPQYEYFLVQIDDLTYHQ